MAAEGPFLRDSGWPRIIFFLPEQRYNGSWGWRLFRYKCWYLTRKAVMDPCHAAENNLPTATHGVES